MRISEQDKSQVIRLIYEAESLAPYDLQAFYTWMRTAYEALGFDPAHQERFAEYYGTCSDSTPVMVSKGIWMLKQALYGNDAPDNYQPTYSQV